MEVFQTVSLFHSPGVEGEAWNLGTGLQQATIRQRAPVPAGVSVADLFSEAYCILYLYFISYRINTDREYA